MRHRNGQLDDFMSQRAVISTEVNARGPAQGMNGYREDSVADHNHTDIHELINMLDLVRGQCDVLQIGEIVVGDKPGVPNRGAARFIEHMAGKQLPDHRVGAVRKGLYLAGTVGDHGGRHVQTATRRENELTGLGQRSDTVGMVDMSGIK